MKLSASRTLRFVLSLTIKLTDQWFPPFLKASKFSPKLLLPTMHLPHPAQTACQTVNFRGCSTSSNTSPTTNTGSCIFSPSPYITILIPMIEISILPDLTRTVQEIQSIHQQINPNSAVHAHASTLLYHKLILDVEDLVSTAEAGAPQEVNPHHPSRNPRRKPKAHGAQAHAGPGRKKGSKMSTVARTSSMRAQTPSSSSNHHSDAFGEFTATRVQAPSTSSHHWSGAVEAFPATRQPSVSGGPLPWGYHAN